MTRAKRRNTAENQARVELSKLDLGQLALFAGQRMNQVVLERLHAAGYEGVRISHGYVVQHLLVADRSVTELARLMGVTQQAASKVTAELTSLGYLENAPAEDARLRLVRLSARGRAMVEYAREVRREIQRELARRVSKREIDRARRVLATMLTQLGGAEAVEQRTVREPR